MTTNPMCTIAQNLDFLYGFLTENFTNEHNQFTDSRLEVVDQSVQIMQRAICSLQADNNHTTTPVVETFIDPSDGFTELTVSVDYHPDREPMSIALSPSQARELISALAIELASIEKETTAK